MTHENPRRSEHIEGSTDRDFGLIFACVFLIIAVWPLFHNGSLRWWAVCISGLFIGIALVKPMLLSPLNKGWTKLGILIGNIVSPIALGILFYAVVTPIGLLMRLTGKDQLNLKRDLSAKSYWIIRRPPGPPPDSMTNQF